MYQGKTVRLHFEGDLTVHFQSTLRGIKMQFNSTPTLQKNEPFTTGNAELDSLMSIWHSQSIALADAEQAGLPEPVIDCPVLPSYVHWQY